MSPLFSHLALGETVDDICLLNGRQPMSDSDGCSTFRSFVQCVLDDSFRLRIKRRGCFVE